MTKKTLFSVGSRKGGRTQLGFTCRDSEKWTFIKFLHQGSVKKRDCIFYDKRMILLSLFVVTRPNKTAAKKEMLLTIIKDL